MSYSMGEVRRWEPAGLEEAAAAVAARAAVAVESGGVLVKGGEELDEGWDGKAADAVLEAAEGEKAHVTRLADGLDELKESLGRAYSALCPAVQSVRDRIAEAEAAGLVVSDVHVEPAPGRHGSDPDALRALVDQHVEAIGAALVTLRSLDEHYGREIDAIAARLHTAIPQEVDRTPIPGPDDPWPGRTLDAATGGAQAALPKYADDLDPATRGTHAQASLPDDHARLEAGRLRTMGRFAGPLGSAATVIDGVKGYVEGEVTAEEAVIETGGALGGGMAGGAALGAAAGSFLGPVGTFVGAGIGAAVGAEVGKHAGDWIHDQFFRDGEDGE